ncbi:MAG: two-component sensor histidine kinase [Bacteroidaceae bacterium]|jgi:signal transduction histidine kinase|nr:two-component sensor histidine kinase [Bacteroidaceae bacterium]
MEQDIDALKKKVEDLQHQLHKQDKMASLGLLSAGIAHEIQNPLNFVINFSKMSVKLLEDLQEIVEDCADKLSEDDAEDLQDISEDLKENLNKIQEHGERAISIIRGILLHSRGKAGEFLPTDAGQLVHEYVWLSYHAMRANDKSFNISIQEDIPEAMPKVMVIPQDLSRAVLNVMNNACYTVKERAQKEGTSYTPTISVKVTLQQNGAEGELTIELKDNGMGMTPEVQKKIFENFFTTKPAGQGTGLGMSITHEIITKNLGGQLILTSEPLVGTTFTFIIPVKITK